MYESVIDLVVGQATMLFVELHYTLATEEAERIGVDHVARMSSNEAGESSLGKLFVYDSKLSWGANTMKSHHMISLVKRERISVFKTLAVSVISLYPSILVPCAVYHYLCMKGCLLFKFYIYQLDFYFCYEYESYVSFEVSVQFA
jgi:hypothetical protein